VASSIQKKSTAMSAVSASEQSCSGISPLQDDGLHGDDLGVVRSATVNDSCQTPSSHVTDTWTEEEDESICPLTDWVQTFRLNKTDDAVVCYLAGYAMKKVSGRVDCQACSVAYQSSCVRSREEFLTSPNNQRMYFIQVKTYDWAKHGLLAPSEQLYEFVPASKK